MLKIYNHFSHDTLTLYDGNSEASPLLGQHCGKSIPPTYYSQTNMAFIHFQADGSVTGTGFELEYMPSSKLYSIKMSISFFFLNLSWKQGSFKYVFEVSKRCLSLNF